MNFFNLFFALLIFAIAYKHYKNIFNPIGIFCAEWLVIIYLYNLKLSSLLQDLSPLTYASLYLSIISFIFGCLFLTRGIYKFNDQDTYNLEKNRSKLIFFYLLFFAISVIEIFAITPAFLAEDKLGTYISPTGRGLIFLHMAIALFPISYVLIFMDSKIKKIYKFILFFPPFIILTLWMYRGMLLGYLTMVIIIYYRRKSIKKIIFNFIFIFIVIVAIFHFIGSLRSTSSFYGYSYINDISEMKVQMPSSLVWIYIYPTTSLANFDRVIKNKNVEYKYGFDILEPIFSIFQIDYLVDIEDDRTTDYDVIAGFNTPTYLYWCYKNFSYLGFFLIPFLIGIISQYLFNQYIDGNPIGIALYSIWFSYIMVSFHDFLLWNSVIIFSIIIVIILNKKINLI